MTLSVEPQVLYSITQVFHISISQAQECSNKFNLRNQNVILQHKTTSDTPLKTPEPYIQSLPRPPHFPVYFYFAAHPKNTPEGVTDLT